MSDLDLKEIGHPIHMAPIHRVEVASHTQVEDLEYGRKPLKDAFSRRVVILLWPYDPGGLERTQKDCMRLSVVAPAGAAYTEESPRECVFRTS